MNLMKWQELAGVQGGECMPGEMEKIWSDNTTGCISLFFYKGTSYDR